MLSVQKASFSRTAQGKPYITFDDAAFARADILFYDPSSRFVSGLIGDTPFSIGTVPGHLGDAFMKCASVVLTAPHPLGHDVVLTAPVLTLQ